MTTFLITTHHNKDTRHEYIREHLFRYDFIPILATDWRFFTHTSLNDKQYKQQSLTMAYYTACQTAIFMQIDEFMIFEDDVCVTSKFILDELLIQLPEDFDLCYLSRTRHNIESAVLTPYDEVFSRVKGNYWETPATVWNIYFAEAFITHIESKINHGLWIGHIDHELMKMNELGLFKFYAPNEQIVIGLSSEPEKAPTNLNLNNSISAK